jgi:hypothetical protein
MHSPATIAVLLQNESHQPRPRRGTDVHRGGRRRRILGLRRYRRRVARPVVA